MKGAFGAGVNHAQLVKLCGNAPDLAGRYSPGECVGIRKKLVEDRPDPKHVGTSYVKRQNLR